MTEAFSCLPQERLTDLGGGSAARHVRQPALGPRGSRARTDPRCHPRLAHERQGHRVRAERKRIVEYLRSVLKTANAELNERRQRLARTVARSQGLVSFLADGSEAVVPGLRDLKAQARAERDRGRLAPDAGLPLYTLRNTKTTHEIKQTT